MLTSFERDGLQKLMIQKEELKVDGEKADTRVSSGETRRKGGPCGLMTGRVGESD